MTTGRELDALVAEKVMGLTVVDLNWPTYLDDDGGHVCAVACLRSDEDYTEYRHDPVVRVDKELGWPPELRADGHRRAMVEVVPFYSTDISDAMTVWEHLRNSQEWCCLQIDSDYSYVWGVKLTRADNSAKSCHEPTVHLEGDERSLACLAELICVAALQAVGHKVDHRFTDLVERKRRRRLP